MKARITLLHRAEKEWNKINFIPAAGEVIIYDPDEIYSYARMKLGDGKTFLNDLPFFVHMAVDEYLNVVDGGRLEDTYSNKN